MQVWNLQVWIWRERSFNMPSKHWHSFRFLACMRLTAIRGSPFSIAVLYPSSIYWSCWQAFFARHFNGHGISMHFSILKRAGFLRFSSHCLEVLLSCFSHYTLCILQLAARWRINDEYLQKLIGHVVPQVICSAFPGSSSWPRYVCHIVASMSPTARYWELPYALCNALSYVLSWQKWSNYSVLASVFFHVSSSRYQVDAASQEFLREKTKTI